MMMTVVMAGMLTTTIMMKMTVVMAGMLTTTIMMKMMKQIVLILNIMNSTG
jgi:hypothetical protein